MDFCKKLLFPFQEGFRIREQAAIERTRNECEEEFSRQKAKMQKEHEQIVAHLNQR